MIANNTTIDTSALLQTDLPLIPQDAPFDEHQRQWLSGLLSGIGLMAKAAIAAQGGPEAATGPEIPVQVLYGSQSGNSEALAKNVRKALTAQGFTPIVSELDACDFDQLHTRKYVLVITSTFGEGDPPDNAKRFYDWILSDAPAAMNDVSFSVLALGDRSYTEFCKCGRDIDTRMEALGASRLAPYTECDVDFDDDFDAWKQQVLTSDTLASAGVTASAAAPAVEDEAETTPQFSKKNPYFATLLSSTNLNTPSSAKRTHHVEIALAGSGMSYEAGDALGVWPTNNPEHVDAILSAVGAQGSEVVSLNATEMPLRLALMNERDLTTATPDLRDQLSSASGQKDNRENLHVIDHLQQGADELTPQALVDALRPLQPRLYSIASSPNAHPGEVHLCVGLVTYELNNLMREGVASTFLANRCSTGGKLGVYTHVSKHFRLPEDGDTPVIMVGPGTGIAPFRAFLEERQVRGSKGHNWLFFGDRNKTHDFLYQDQLERMQTDGVLNKLSLAWSRDAEKKTYVQHLMLEGAAELYAMLQEGAHVYVCGDASRMAKDVDSALKQVIAEQSGKGEEHALQFVQELTDNSRYQRDVY